MGGARDLRMLELLTARLCHELVGPVTAIGAGVELFAEEDAGFAAEAAALVAQSARQAAGRLEFYRFAYGFSGDATMTGPAPCELASRFFAKTGIECDYRQAVRALPLDRQKLACNLLLVGAEALPRGGRLALGAAAGLELDAVGQGAALSAEAALALSTPTAALSARGVQAGFAGLLARRLGCRLIAAAAEPGRVRLTAAAV